MNLNQAITQCIASWKRAVDDGRMSAQTLDKWLLLLQRLDRYAAAHDVDQIEDVTPVLAGRFVHAQGRNRHGERSDSALTTMSNRRTVIRALITQLRREGIPLDDPTLGIVLAPRSRADYRPVTDEEASELRFFGHATTRQTSRATVIALALCGAHSGEIADLTIGGIELAASVMHLPGTTYLHARTAALDSHARAVLAARIRYLLAHGGNQHTPLAGTGRGTAAQKQARVCTAITTVIGLAGLGDDKTIRPTSLTAYAGAVLFRETGHIEDAARVLGCRSLDRAAALIGYHWPTGETA